jgi:hypothetical protein
MMMMMMMMMTIINIREPDDDDDDDDDNDNNNNNTLSNMCVSINCNKMCNHIGLKCIPILEATSM